VGGKECHNTRHEIVIGFPASVTEIDCSDMVESCKADERTLAIVSTNRSRDTMQSKFLEPGLFPITQVYDYRSDSCTLDEALKFLGVFVGILVASVISVCCVLILACRIFAVRRQRTLSTSSYIAETLDQSWTE